MGACAEGDARIEAHVDGVLVGKVVPGRHDPETVGDLSRLELRLRDADPVGVLDLLGAEKLGLFALEGLDGDGKRCLEVEVVVGKNGDDGARPGAVVGLESRFAVERLFVGRFGVGVLDGGGERARVHQHVGKRFGAAFVGKNLNLAHKSSTDKKNAGVRSTPAAEKKLGYLWASARDRSFSSR